MTKYGTILYTTAFKITIESDLENLPTEPRRRRAAVHSHHSAFQSPYDETDNHKSNDEDKNDDAEGFSGFALQKQEQDRVAHSVR